MVVLMVAPMVGRLAALTVAQSVALMEHQMADLWVEKTADQLEHMSAAEKVGQKGFHLATSTVE